MSGGQQVRAKTQTATITQNQYFAPTAGIPRTKAQQSTGDIKREKQNLSLPNPMFCTNGGGVGDGSIATNGDNNKNTGVGDGSIATNGDIIKKTWISRTEAKATNGDNNKEQPNYPYLILKITIVPTNVIDAIFAIIIGKELIAKP
jgi:hypothetical protein